MATAFLAAHGIDLESEISHAQSDTAHVLDSQTLNSPERAWIHLPGVRLPQHPPSTLHDLSISPSTGCITSITPHDPQLTPDSPPANLFNSKECFVAPSLCHPHIHLDKAFLLSSNLHAAHQPTKGTFSEALALTSTSKSQFTEPDLYQRGTWLLAESAAAGVTHMRAFVEVDEVVGLMCVRVGLRLKREWQTRCEVQICVFAQEAVMDSDGENRRLVEEAVGMDGVEAVGSAPYVEKQLGNERANIEWIVALAGKVGLHLDLHLDYHLEKEREPSIWFVLEVLRKEGWVEKGMKGKTICLGHCSRLTLFKEDDWQKLRQKTEALPVWFIGLPTSDLFMMGRPSGRDWDKPAERFRGTLQVPWMIRNLRMRAALGVNNVGNAFTPQGSVDPLSLASLAVGIYQAGTELDAEILYACVSTHARAAIGWPSSSLKPYPQVGDVADLVLYGKPHDCPDPYYRRRRTLQGIVYDAPFDRITIKEGCKVSTN